MKRIVFLHPSIHTVKDTIEYLSLDNSVNIEELIWDDNNPEIVFASEHIYKNYKMMKRLKRYYNQGAILIYQAGEASFPDLTIFDYAIAINTRLTNLDRIVRIPPTFFYSRSTIKNVKINDLTFIEAKKLYEQKTSFCNFIYSNPVAHPMRDSLFHEISKYKKVDSLGGHLNNMKNKTNRRNKNWAVLSVKMKEPYKFTIASENALFDGYTSEKLLTSFQAHSIPIYWGNPYVAEEFNKEAFVNCHDYDTVEQIVERIKEIDNNKELWSKMISAPWQTNDQIIKANNQMKVFASFMQKLFADDLASLRRRPEGTFADIYAKWFFRRFHVKNTFLVSIKNHIKKRLGLSK